jgi:fused signal recognition particle receptor
VARDWDELFITGRPAALATEPEPQREERRRGFFRRMRENMRKTREALSAEVQATLFQGDLDEETWERLEEALIYADVGARTTAQVVAQLEQEAEEGDLVGGEALTARLAELLAKLARTGDDTIDLRHDPTVILVVGVNGTGKTTTVGKLALALAEEGKQPVLAAADTFRAAATEQLVIWGDRVGAPVVRHQQGADPAAVAFDGLASARARGADVLLVDTAGRLHTKSNLMEELRKLRRVLEREGGQVREVLLVLDATTGQNGLAQARQFTDAVGVTGVVLTKLDGTAKGGIVIAVQRDLGIPVKLVGLGEGPHDLAPFDPDAFVDALLSDDGA